MPDGTATRTALAAPESSEPVLGELRFVEADVPCADGTLRYVYDVLRDWTGHPARSGSPTFDWIRAVVDAPAATPDLAHRQLLTLRKRLGRYGYGRDAVISALHLLRPHSRLYTPRACYCLSQAWRDFRERSKAMLTGCDGTWAVTHAGRTWTDWLPRSATVEISELLEYADRSARIYGQAPTALTLTRETPDQIELTVWKGRQRVSFTFTRLPADQAAVAEALRWHADFCGPAGPYRGAPAAHVARWPQQLVTIWPLWAKAGSGRGVPADVISAQAAAVADLSETGVHIASRLGPDWHGSLRDLVRTAAAAAAPSVSAG